MKNKIDEILEQLKTDYRTGNFQNFPSKNKIMKKEKKTKNGRWNKVGDYEEISVEFLCPHCQKELFFEVKKLGKQTVGQVRLKNKEYKRIGIKLEEVKGQEQN